MSPSNEELARSLARDLEPVRPIPSLRVAARRIGSFNEWDNDLDEIAFLADVPIGRVIRIPWQMRKRRIDAD